MKLRILMFTTLGLAALLTGFFVLTLYRSMQPPPLPILGEVPEFQYFTADSTAFSLDDIRGRYVVVDFIFTSCPTACPVMSSKMKKFYDRYRGQDDVRFVSFSVDPKNDTFPVLREYAAQWGVDDDRWVFVRTDTASISEFCEKGFYLSGDLPNMHSTRFVLVDPQGRIRGYYDAFDDDQMKKLQTDLDNLKGGF